MKLCPEIGELAIYFACKTKPGDPEYKTEVVYEGRRLYRRYKRDGYLVVSTLAYEQLITGMKQIVALKNCEDFERAAYRYIAAEFVRSTLKGGS